MALALLLLSGCGGGFTPATGYEPPDRDPKQTTFTPAYFSCPGDPTCANLPTLTEAQYQARLLERFDAIDAGIYGGEGYSLNDNREANLSWGESYVMMAYLTHYRGRGDVAVLKKLARHIKNVLAHRDDIVGSSANDYRGRTRATWISTAYTPVPVSFVVHSGMILFPIADFAQLIIRTPSLWNEQTEDGITFRAFADTLVARSRETIAAHEEEWDEAGGYYKFPADAPFLLYGDGTSLAGLRVPYNMEHALGRAIVALYLATGDVQYKARAERLAQGFLANLTNNGDGTFFWLYWQLNPNAPEDLSHGAITAHFAQLCWSAEIGFSTTQVLGFARTFAQSQIRTDRLFNYNIGRTELATMAGDAISWLPLSTFDSRIYQSIWEYFRFASAFPEDAEKYFNGGGAGELLGTAYLLRYRDFFLSTF